MSKFNSETSYLYQLFKENSNFIVKKPCKVIYLSAFYDVFVLYINFYSFKAMQGYLFVYFFYYSFIIYEYMYVCMYIHTYIHIYTAVAMLIHFRRDFRAQSSDFFILLRSYVWYFANNSCALNRFGSDEWQFYYLANRYLERVGIPLYSENNSPHK